MTRGLSKKRQREIDRIICTSVADAKSSLLFIHDVGLLQDCITAENSRGGRVSMIQNIKIRIRQLEHEEK